MNIRHLEEHARSVTEALRSFGAEFCVVGGIAVSFRTLERTTKDLDLAVAVADDSEAEAIVRHLRESGFRIEQLLEHDVTHRLSTVRLISKGTPEVFVDLLFASSGIEREVVQTAEPIEIFPNVIIKVAAIPSLIALKVLSADDKDRGQDIIDLRNLIKESTETDRESVRELLNLITSRGYNRSKDLLKEIDKYC